MGEGCHASHQPSDASTRLLSDYKTVYSRAVPLIHIPCHAERSDEAAGYQQRADCDAANDETVTAAGRPPVIYSQYHTANVLNTSSKLLRSVSIACQHQHDIDMVTVSKQL